MDTTSPELASALLQWINSFELPTKISSWQDLEAGSEIWSILGDIDPEYFQGSLPHPDHGQNENWIARWQNWKHIEKCVTTYIREECDKLPNLTRKLNPDLKAIASRGSQPDILKVVKAALLAAMYSPQSNERMVEVMQTLGAKVAQPIATLIGDLEDLDRRLAELNAEADTSSEVDYSTDSEAPRPGPSYGRDPELELEERLIQALHDKKAAEQKLAEATSNLDTLQNKVTSLEDELAETRYTLDRRRGKDLDNDNITQMSQRADRDREYIAELETELASAKSTLDQQDRQLDKLKSDAESKQQLRDELQMVKSERDELAQKAKANENLKRKIHALQEQEKANHTLRQDLQSAQEQLHQLDTLHDRCSALEKANEENAQTIANGEQEIFDQKTSKKRLEHDMKLLAQKYEQTRDMLNNAQETIRDLEDRFHGLESSQDHSDQLESLDAELAAEAGGNDEKAARRSVALPTFAAETIVLQQNLQIANASIARLEQRCLDLFQENLGFKTVIDEAMDASAMKDLHPFQHQAKKLESLSKELDDTKSKYIATTSEAADVKHRLDVANQKLSSNNEPLPPNSLTALTENRDRQAYVTELESALAEQRALLRHALLNTDALLREDSTGRRASELRLVRTQLETVRAAPAPDAEKTVGDVSGNIVSRIEGVREALGASEKKLASSESTISALESELKTAKSRPKEPTPTADPTDLLKLKREVQNLERENKLVASAWYDLTCRLQSNTVLLARRNEGGKSWVGRMRGAVNSAGAGSLGAGTGKGRMMW